MLQKLRHHLDSLTTVLGVVALQRLCESLGVRLLVIAELHGAVAVLTVSGLRLHHMVRAGVYHGDANGAAVLVVDAGLSKFFTNEPDHAARKF